MCLVINLKKDASASRGLEVVLTTLTALVVKTHMEKNLLSAQDWNKHKSKKKEACSDEFGKHTR